MIYELRIYTAHPGKMGGLMKRFRDHTMELFERHGIHNVGYWTNSVGGRSDELWYIVSFESHGQREEAWKNFGADPEWQAARAASEEAGAAGAPHREPDSATDRMVADAIRLVLYTGEGVRRAKSAPPPVGEVPRSSGEGRGYQLPGDCLAKGPFTQFVTATPAKLVSPSMMQACHHH